VKGLPGVFVLAFLNVKTRRVVSSPATFHPEAAWVARQAELRYYLSSLELGVKNFTRAVRGHWGIENSCHWTLDFTYREDESRIRDKHVRENFAWLNRFTLSLLKQHPDKASLVMKRRSCGWSHDFLTQVVTGATL
jgi:predicted transposase YbfD/YdcC